MKKHKILKSSLLLALTVAFLSLSTLAFKSSEKEICEGDIDAHCKYIRDERKLYHCLAKNEDELSEECRSVLDSYQRKIENYKLACGDDLKEFCPELDFKFWLRSFQCLSEHEAELSDECRYHIEVLSWIHKPDQVILRE